MAIPSETIEQIAAANDIADVIGSYFPLKRAGANFKALCPFHQERTPSFMVNPQRQTFHCFGCGVGGSAFRFVMEYEHVDFPAAVRKLAARVGIQVVEERGSNAAEDRQHEARRTLLQLHAEAAEWFHHNLLKKDFAKAARDYLKRRKIDNVIAKNWKIGFAPDEWDAFGSWARGHGYNQRELLLSGLVKTRDSEDSPQQTSDAEHQNAYDRFRGRIMFPICNDTGEVVAFSGRVLDGDAKAAKYINSPETPLFRKGSLLFGLHKSKRALIEANNAVVCEGQLDLITLFEAGITNVVAPQGTAFTEQQARLLKRYVNEVVLCFDADEAGQKAAERSLDALLQNDLVVRVAEIPAGDDPDSFVRGKGKEAFTALISSARDFFDYWIEREATKVDSGSMSDKLDLARRLADTVARVHDPMMRGEVVSKVSARLGVARADFERLIPRERQRGSGERPKTAPTPAPPHEMAMLCLLALRDGDARDFLREQNWREVLGHLPGSALLERILEADLRPADAASLNVFMATLSPEEEGLVSGWLLQRLPTEPKQVAEEWWRGLRRMAIRRQLEVAETRIGLPQLSTGEVVNLQKQILDLREQLHEFGEFSAARLGGQ